MSQNNLPANGTADGSGNLAITFPPIANNTEFSGVLSIPSAPNTAQVSVLVNGQTIATIGGSSQYGVIQINNNDVLQLTGTGFLPDVQYQAILSGFLAQGSVGQLIPTPTASQVEAALIGTIESENASPEIVFGPAAVVGTVGTSIPIFPNTRTIIVNLQSASWPNLEVVGDQSHFIYRFAEPVYLSDFSVSFLAVVPIAGSMDTSVTVTSSANATMTVASETDTIPESVFYNGIVKNLSGASLSLSGPCRLLTAFLIGTGTGSLNLAGFGPILEVTSVGEQATLSWPDNVVLAEGSSITASGALTNAGVTYAYP
jgi:hypothetical protein